MKETALDPDLPIIDAHHHLWDLRPMLPALAAMDHPFIDMMRAHPLYLLDELAADTAGGGHNVIATIYMECGSFYRSEGPDHLKPVGEVEQVAALTKGGGGTCAAIVGHADLTHERVAETLEAQLAAGDGRFRGIRHAGARDDDPAVLGPLAATPRPAALYARDDFRRGFAQLTAMNLSFDAWVLEPQIGEVTALARAFPDTPIMLDHVGTPLGLGNYAGTLGERFEIWRAAIRDLAKCGNVSVKLGGLAMAFCALPPDAFTARPLSETLAEMWRPYIETCVDAFGVDRALFESNFPVDNWGADYATLWNAFKRVTAGASAAEKARLYSGSAANFYRIDPAPH